MHEHQDLHRHYVQLLAGFFADHMFAATAGSGRFVFGQLVDDFDTCQSADSGSLSGSLNNASCGVLDSTLWLDLRLNRRWRSSLFCSFRSTMCVA